MNVCKSIVLLLALTLCGCATRKYDWGNYDTKLYQFYKNPASAEEFRTSLQAHIEGLEANKLIPPPGLYAELGTLHLDRGDDKSAIVYYKKEREAWKESVYLMDTMISTLEKRAKPGSQQ